MDKIRCPWCGTENASGRTYCSSCGTRFVPPKEGESSWEAPPESINPVPPGSAEGPAVPPQPAMPPGVLHGTPAAPPQPPSLPSWPPTATWPSAQTQATGSMVGVLLIGIAVLVLLAMALFLYQRLQSGISFPETIAACQHNESQLADAATEFMEKTIKSMGLEAKAAVYGDSTSPCFLIIAFEADGPSLTGGGLEDFASGFAGSGAGSVDTGRAVSETREGVTYRCAPIILNRATTIGDPRAVCLWTDQETAGVVIDTVSVDTTAAMDLAATVHDGVAG